MNLTITLEKIFFAYILDNKKYFPVVEPHFFKNNSIIFVYDIIRKYMIADSSIELPSPKQIWEMVSLEDKTELITKDILKMLLTVKLDEYDEVNFIIPKFNSWITTNKIKLGVSDIVDESRSLDDATMEEANAIIDKMKTIFTTMTSDTFSTDDEDLGADFDDPEAHAQDTAKYKVKTGIPCLDQMLGGGFDVAALHCIMAMTNGGKSLWLQNIAVNCANLGYNVLYVSLEMSERKVFKRLGAMRFKIPINDYDTISMDTEYMKRCIREVQETKGNSLLEKKAGKIYCKFWPAGTISNAKIDNHIQKLQEKKGVKIDLLIIDYLTLMVSNTTAKGDTLYIKGKNLAEGARALAAKYNCPALTAMQVSKEAWNAKNISLEMVPESKAIPETSDTFIALVRTPEMKEKNLFMAELLKQRDGDFSNSKFLVNMNPVYLSLENDRFMNDN